MSLYWEINLENVFVPNIVPLQDKELRVVCQADRGGNGHQISSWTVISIDDAAAADVLRLEEGQANV